MASTAAHGTGLPSARGWPPVEPSKLTGDPTPVGALAHLFALGGRYTRSAAFGSRGGSHSEIYIELVYHSFNPSEKDRSP